MPCRALPGPSIVLLLAVVAVPAAAASAELQSPTTGVSPEVQDIPFAEPRPDIAAEAPGEAVAAEETPGPGPRLRFPASGLQPRDQALGREQSPGEHSADTTDEAPRKLRPAKVPGIPVPGGQGREGPGPAPIEDVGAALQDSAPVVRFSVTTTAGGAFVYDSVRWLNDLELAVRPDLVVRSGADGFGGGLYLEGGGRFGPRGPGALLGGGAVLVAPIEHDIAFVPSLGAFATHRAGQGWQPGVGLGSFVGLRIGSPRSPYEPSLGLRIDLRYHLGPVRELSASVAVQLDPRVIWCVATAQSGGCH